MLDAEVYAYGQTGDVRTTGQILAHVANAQYMFCSAAGGEESPHAVNFEETATTKDDVVAREKRPTPDRRGALKDFFGYCGGMYGNLTDAQGLRDDHSSGAKWRRPARSSSRSKTFTA